MQAVSWLVVGGSVRAVRTGPGTHCPYVRAVRTGDRYALAVRTGRKYGPYVRVRKVPKTTPVRTGRTYAVHTARTYG